MKPKIRSEVEAYSSSLFSVKQFDVSLPDGKNKTYEMIDIQKAVTILPIDDENNVYLVEQFRIGAKKSLLELPAGKVEEGEDPLTTAQRELREETGMDARDLKPVGGFYMTPGYSNEYMHCFLATGLFPSPIDADADEFIHLHKIPLANMVEMVKGGEIEDSATLAALLLAYDRLNI